MPITALPPAPLVTDPPQTFNQKGFALVAALATAVTETNALQADVTAKSSDVTTKAADVVTKHGSVTTMAADVTAKQADIVTRQADVTTKQSDVTTKQADVTARQADVVTRQADVVDKQAAAAASAAAAAVSENNALIYATQQLTTVSTTSLATGTGQKTATVEPNKALAQGQYLVWTSAGAPGNRMGGIVDSYNKATGAITQTFDLAVGSATRSDWVVAVGASGAIVSLASLYRGSYFRESNGGTLATNSRYRAYTGPGAVAMTMPTPANCAAGDEILLLNHNAKWGINTFTVNCPALVTIFSAPTATADSVLVLDTNDATAIRLVCSHHTGTAAEWTVNL